MGAGKIPAVNNAVALGEIKVEGMMKPATLAGSVRVVATPGVPEKYNAFAATVGRPFAPQVLSVP